MALRGEATTPTYRNLAPIGPGASQTQRAYHDVLKRWVVQKTVPLAVLHGDALARSEPVLLESLSHPSIPRIYEAQFDPERDGYVTFVMDAVGDIDATEVVLGRKPPLSVGECVTVGLQLLSALSYLHVVKNVLHRDIKPDNLRLSADRRHSWLIDFNLATSIGSDDGAQGVATPFQWMAPEVAGTARYCVTSEIFSLGVTLYELLRGRLMSADYPPEKIEQRVTRHQRGFPDAHYRRFPVHAPERLRRILTKAMSADPAKRWQSTDEMRTALANLVYIDWQVDTAQDGRWVGSWPSSRPVTQRLAVEISTRTVRSGVSRGRQRATARYQPGDTWRRLPGLQDRDMRDAADLSQFFDDAERRVASLRPAW